MTGGASIVRFGVLGCPLWVMAALKDRQQPDLRVRGCKVLQFGEPNQGHFQERRGRETRVQLVGGAGWIQQEGVVFEM